MNPTSCTRCDSADVRPSRRSFELGLLGLFRYRCRACGGLFWLRSSRVEAVRARRQDYLDTPLGAPQDPVGLLDTAAGTLAPTTDLSALDHELDQWSDTRLP